MADFSRGQAFFGGITCGPLRKSRRSSAELRSTLSWYRPFALPLVVLAETLMCLHMVHIREPSVFWLSSDFPGGQIAWISS
jgi:hypothetical protein